MLPFQMPSSGHDTEQLGFQNELALLILLARLKGLVILPADRLFALFAEYIPHHMPTCRHIAFPGLARRYIHDTVEEVRFAMLATEILRTNQYVGSSPGAEQTYPTYDIVMVGEVCLAVLAAIDLARLQVDVVSQAHDSGRATRS